MRVPPAGSLLPLPAFPMVKSLSMNEVLDASKEKMFASLFLDSSAKALSRYTETLDDIIRTQAEKLQQGSELARVRLNEMDLPDSILALEGNFTLPTALKEDVEAVSIWGCPAALHWKIYKQEPPLFSRSLVCCLKHSSSVGRDLKIRASSLFPISCLLFETL
ncbi:hypothetical protein F0562_033422 [Nyssa sinensis]|uniref:Uncharacterized protein n=1 Tax=Nyssa sinensis TaxID=561372 RepID=A0A5J5AEU6_9ASTE|nr:hypothetical protein F0562_033422 [Nyssa sinensis]